MTKCTLKGTSGIPKDQLPDKLVEPTDYSNSSIKPDTIRDAFLGVFFGMLGVVFIVHLIKKAPNTDFFGFPLKRISGGGKRK